MPDTAEHFARAGLRMRGFASRRVRTSEGDIHLVERWGGGTGPTLVLLHGLGSTCVHYGPLLRRVGPRVKRMIALDMPAHGFSDLPRSGMAPDRLVDALFEALDDVITEPVALFGNSMGGYAATRYAIERPENVRALVLASPAGAHTSPKHLDELRATFSLDDHRKALEFIDRLLAKPTAMRHVMAWGARRKFRRPEMVSLLEAIDPDRHSLDPVDIAALAVPILLLWGEADRILPREHLAFWRESLPVHAEVEEPSGMGHSPFLDRPGAVSRRVLAFLSGLDG
jgi:pimeloyl-ACP methyl ester carboxylesterase